jgi:hypothetical protein
MAITLPPLRSQGDFIREKKKPDGVGSPTLSGLEGQYATLVVGPE